MVHPVGDSITCDFIFNSFHFSRIVNEHHVLYSLCKDFFVLTHRHLTSVALILIRMKRRRRRDTQWCIEWATILHLNARLCARLQ